MSALSLLLLAAQITELGTVEFPAGPARGTARFYLSGSEPRVEVRLRNEGAADLWWGGAGQGCISSHWLVDPTLPDGGLGPAGMQGISCSTELTRLADAAFLASALIPPGEERTWEARPFSSRFEEPEVPVPALEHWAWCHEFTLPRASRPWLTTGFEEHALLLAWSRATGPRAHLGDPDLVHGKAFDPFAPPLSSPDAVPIRIGPLIGEARLTSEGRDLRVAWTLRNPTHRTIDWSPGPWSKACTEGFLERADCACGVGTGSTFGAFGEGTSIPPGGTMEGHFAPFLDFVSGEPMCENPAHAPGREPWHYVLECGWPVAAEDGDRSGPAAWLHLAWGPSRGIRMWMSLETESAGARSSEEGAVASAARRVGAGWFVAQTLHGDPRTLRIFAAPDLAEACWHDRETVGWADFRWQAEDALPLNPPRPPAAAPPSPAPPPSHISWRITGPQELEDATFRLNGRMGDPHVQRGPSPWRYLPWEYARWAMAPRAELPRHEQDYELVLLRLEWDPASGLDLRAEPAPPR